MLWRKRQILMGTGDETAENRISIEENVKWYL